MRFVLNRGNAQSMISSQLGLIAGLVVAFYVLRGTHHIAHFWPIAFVLTLGFELTLLLRVERT